MKSTTKSELRTTNKRQALLTGERVGAEQTQDQRPPDQEKMSIKADASAFHVKGVAGTSVNAKVMRLKW